MSLPITARQMNALRALQRKDPDLGELATAIALAFPRDEGREPADGAVDRGKDLPSHDRPATRQS